MRKRICSSCGEQAKAQRQLRDWEDSDAVWSDRKLQKFSNKLSKLSMWTVHLNELISGCLHADANKRQWSWKRNRTNNFVWWFGPVDTGVTSFIVLFLVSLTAEHKANMAVDLLVLHAKFVCEASSSSSSSQACFSESFNTQSGVSFSPWEDSSGTYSLVRLVVLM